MMRLKEEEMIVGHDDPILITGSGGFIGARVVNALLRSGFTNLRCLVRSSGNIAGLRAVVDAFPRAHVEVMAGNLLSRDDCAKAASQAAIIFHLAAGSDKSYSGSFMSCAVTTRNLLDAAVRNGSLRRFVNVSSFAVYSNAKLSRRSVLDESCDLDHQVLDRAEAYAYAKLKQEELVRQYAEAHDLRYVIVRPGAVFGPGAPHITGRVGIDTFGVFLHLGGSNRIPFTYVDNCADAIVMAGTKAGVDNEVFNIVDDDLPTSRHFLRMYKRQGKRFRSISIPYWFTRVFSWAWAKYSNWSRGQLPPAFNPNRCITYWRGNRYSNQKLKDRLGWKPEVSFPEAMKRYTEYVRKVS